MVEDGLVGMITFWVSCVLPDLPAMIAVAIVVISWLLLLVGPDFSWLKVLVLVLIVVPALVWILIVLLLGDILEVVAVIEVAVSLP